MNAYIVSKILNPRNANIKGRREYMQWNWHFLIPISLKIKVIIVTHNFNI
jgi:hypothetical protein